MDEVGADGDFARYQGSMHEVHDKVDRIPYGTVNLGGTAGAFYALVPYVGAGVFSFAQK